MKDTTELLSHAFEKWMEGVPAEKVESLEGPHIMVEDSFIPFTAGNEPDEEEDRRYGFSIQTGKIEDEEFRQLIKEGLAKRKSRGENIDPEDAPELSDIGSLEPSGLVKYFNKYVDNEDKKKCIESKKEWIYPAGMRRKSGQVTAAFLYRQARQELLKADKGLFGRRQNVPDRAAGTEDVVHFLYYEDPKFLRDIGSEEINSIFGPIILSHKGDKKIINSGIFLTACYNISAYGVKYFDIETPEPINFVGFMLRGSKHLALLKDTGEFTGAKAAGNIYNHATVHGSLAYMSKGNSLNFGTVKGGIADSAEGGQHVNMVSAGHMASDARGVVALNFGSVEDNFGWDAETSSNMGYPSPVPSVIANCGYVGGSMWSPVDHASERGAVIKLAIRNPEGRLGISGMEICGIKIPEDKERRPGFVPEEYHRSGENGYCVILDEEKCRKYPLLLEYFGRVKQEFEKHSDWRKSKDIVFALRRAAWDELGDEVLKAVGSSYRFFECNR